MSSFADTFERFADRVLPASLSDSTIRTVRARAALTCLQSNRVARAKDGKTTLAFVARGATKLVAHTASARAQVVAFHFADDLFTLPGEAAHQFEIEALVDSALILVPYTAFRALALDDPRMLAPLLNACELSLARSRDKIIALGRKSAPERIADFLLAMAARIGTLKDSGTMIELPMSRRDIADSLGLTIETVSRQLTLLRDDRIITTRGRGCVGILDHALLEARSGRFVRAPQKKVSNLRWINVGPVAAT